MLPQRIILSILAFLGIGVSLALRMCLSIALTEMVKPIEINKVRNDTTICPAVNLITGNNTHISNITQNKGPQYSWTQEEQGWILSSFFGGYLIGHVPGATFTDKYSAKWLFSLSILLPTVLNAATPLFLTYGKLTALLLIRALMGLFGAFMFPAANMLLAVWVPKKERSSLGTLVLGGGQVGGIFTFYITGVLLTFYPWPVVFYFWSIVSIIWFIAFTLLCSKDPASHPLITKKEKDFLRTEIGQLQRDSDLPPIPWKHIITSVPVIALLISQMGTECLFTVMGMGLPKYMKEIIGFSVHAIGFYFSVFSLLSWIVSIISGFLCDFLIDRKYFTIVQARKFFTALSGLFPPIFLVIASYVECNRIIYIAMMLLAAGFGANHFVGVRVNTLDLAPNYAGAILSYVNGVATIVSFIFPILVGMIISDSTIQQWRIVFWIVFVVGISRVTIFSIFASGLVQSWNNPKRHVSFECDRLRDDKAENSAEQSISK